MSGLRCRPGDLAVIVRMPTRNPELLGAFCNVLHASLGGIHQMPDGHWAEGVPPDYWLIEFHMPIRVYRSNGGHHFSRYVDCPDAALRPIRPDADEPATETEREKEAA